MQKLLKYMLVAVLLLLGGILFYKKIYIPKSTYETAISKKGDLSVEVFGIGNVGAKYIYSITAQTGGKILSILTDEGKWVKKGDLLITIDSVDIPQLIDEANLSMRKSNSEWVASKKELKSLFAQKHLAQITYDRYVKLKKQSFVSKAEYDKAKADLDVIEAQISVTNAHIRSAKMEAERTQKAVEALKQKLARYKIYAPVNGVVIARSAQVAQTVLPSQPIIKIVDPKDVWVNAYIDEKISGSVKVGEKANITLRSQYEKYFKGTVKRIVAQSDAVTQEREVNVAFDTLPMPFYINEQAEVRIASKTYKGVVKVPLKALAYYKEKTGVWTEDSGKAHFVPVKVLGRGHSEAAITGLANHTKILIGSEKKKPLKEGVDVH